MKITILLFILIISGVEQLSAQLFYTEVMDKRPPLEGAVKIRSRSLPYPFRLYQKRLDNRLIENPGVRYAIQNIKKEDHTDPQVKNAINLLMNYAEDARLKNVLEYLKNYAKGIAEKEKAIETLQRQITYDSIQFFHNEEYLLGSDMDDYMNNDLQTFVSYIQNDSNYIWLRNASRDSVLLQVMNASDNIIRFWVNNGKNQYYRFWASNNQGDPIGTWIQVMPKGNNLRIYVDEGVYQASAIQKKEVDPIQSTIGNTIGKEYTSISVPKVGQLIRRHWTYYSEVEIAMSQGALVNWASGGENSLSLLSNLRYFWNYNRNNTSWENWVHYRFGFMKNGNEDIRKNEDRFELNSKLGQKAFKHWYYTAQFNTLTQLFSSYDYPKDKERNLVANFMSPGYFTISLGLDYKPKDNFSLFISPIAGKWNFVRDTVRINASRYGVEAGKRAKRNAGARVDLRSKVTNLFKMMDIRNELTLFWSYDEKKENKEGDKILPLTANWKLTIDFKINYFMRASIYTETIYDQNYSNKLQFKENLNLGVNFRF